MGGPLANLENRIALGRYRGQSILAREHFFLKTIDNHLGLCYGEHAANGFQRFIPLRPVGGSSVNDNCILAAPV